MNKTMKGMLGVIVVIACTSTAARADGGLFDNMDFTFGGFVRAEVAAKTTGDENPNNQRGNPFDSRSELRTPVLPPASDQALVGNLNAGLGTALSVPPIGTWANAVPLPLASSVTRPVAPANNFFNYHILRAEGEFGWTITQHFKMVGRLRAIGDFGDYSNFNAPSLGGLQGGISGGNPALYGGAPNYFQYQVEGDKHPLPLELDGPNYQAYFPALFVDYTQGPLNVRVGEQTIAWGNAIFFRVFDTANGIDFRRHSILDYEQEEYSDKRVPAPAIRVNYQLNDNVLIDGYVERFTPTVYGNPNTPYNVIPSQFTVHDDYADYENKLSYAIRVTADFGDWSLEGFAGRRYNPDGVFRWTASGVNKALPYTSPLGAAVNLTNVASGAPDAGPALAGTPFEVAPGGVYSPTEWFHYAGLARLNGVSGLNASIDDFQPSTGQVYASDVSSYQGAYNELSTFFTAAGGSLRGHIARDYFQEYNFGLGAGYTTEGEPGSLLDQLLIHVEVSYTPDRTYTSPDLNTNFLHQNDWVGALTLEKYYRFTTAFPATYMVFQYMHRTRDDLFGRSLEGYGGTDTKASPGVSGGANYIVFAFQQPFPRDIYRIGFAALYDPRGGILVQPGVQWKINTQLSVDAFYTYINDHIGGTNPNNNLLGGTQFGNEMTLRVAYQF